jgi:ABC-type multidrug transport system ATPase subunit
MDEADLLGDRIAIMADGQLRCVGTPMFLKSRFGVGYHMTLVKTPSCDVSKVERLITSSVAGSKMVGNVSSELSFILPRDQSTAFPELFGSLEDHKMNLGIESYGVSVTTMEEVFLRVSSGEMGSTRASIDPSSQMQKSQQRMHLLEGFGLLKQQFRAVLVKRYDKPQFEF